MGTRNNQRDDGLPHNKLNPAEHPPEEDGESQIVAQNDGDSSSAGEAPPVLDIPPDVAHSPAFRRRRHAVVGWPNGVAGDGDDDDDDDAVGRRRRRNGDRRLTDGG